MGIVGKVLSLVVVVSYLIGFYLLAGVEIWGGLLMYLGFALVLIWLGGEGNPFPERIGRIHFGSESPGCLIPLIGWVLLLLPAALIVVILIRRH